MSNNIDSLMGDWVILKDNLTCPDCSKPTKVFHIWAWRMGLLLCRDCITKGIRLYDDDYKPVSKYE